MGRSRRPGPSPFDVRWLPAVCGRRTRVGGSKRTTRRRNVTKDVRTTFLFGSCWLCGTHTHREREREREIERQLRVWPEVTRGAHHSTKRLLIRALHLHTTCVHLGGGVGGSGGGGIPSIIPSISGSNLKIRGCVFFQFKKWICSYWYCRSQINVLVPVEDFGFVLCCSKRIWSIQCLRPKINQSILPRIPSIFGFYLRMREN